MPRGRPRKRLSRIDAAIDAMSQYGFPEEKVRKHVNELLMEYGGDEAWPFLEDCSYKELLEAILREQETGDQVQVAQNGDQVQDKSGGDEEPPETSSRASGTRQDETPQENAAADIAAVAESGSTEFTLVINRGEADGRGWKDILPYQNSALTEENTAKTLKGNYKNSPTKLHSPKKSQLPASNDILALPQTNSRRSSQHYGWFESDDEDEPDDFIFLKPATGPLGAMGAKPTMTKELSSCLGDEKRKRRSRWDEKPYEER